MGSKYKSPLIRSRNTSATAVASTPDRSSTDERTGFGGSDVLVYDNIPRPSSVTQHLRGRGYSSPRFDSPRPSPVNQHFRGRGCSSPRFDSTRPPRGSPYRWTPPSQTGFCDNSWSSQVIDRLNAHTFSSSCIRPIIILFVIFQQQNNSGGHSTCRPQFSKYRKQNTNVSQITTNIN